jgi:hypothetical protein
LGLKWIKLDKMERIFGVKTDGRRCELKAFRLTLKRLNNE